MSEPPAIDVSGLLGTAEGRVGFVGLGRMGAAMLDAVIAGDLPVCVFDVRADAVATYVTRAGVDVVGADSPRDLAARSIVIDVVVNTDDQVLDVCLGDNGLLAGARPGTVVLIHSTIALPTLRKAAAAAEEVGVHLLDAAVSGRFGHRSVGDLCVMVGGDVAAFSAVKPVLDTYGGLVLHLGPLGAGLDTKLALNVVRYASMLATKEANSLLQAAGVQAPFWQIVEHTGAMGTPRAPEGLSGDALAEMRDPGRQLNNAATARKDLRAAVSRGAELGVELAAAGKTIETIHTFWGVPAPASYETE